MIGQILAVARSEATANLAGELLGWINGIGNRKQRLTAIQAVTRVMRLQQRTVLEMAARLEAEQREAISPAELLGLLAIANEYAFEVLAETADWEGAD